VARRGVRLELTSISPWLGRASSRASEVPEAISHLGSAYRFGQLGLVKSDKKAAKIWKRAVELGNVLAMVNLGFLYSTGSGVKLDKKKAEQLYRMAADRGNATAQTNLGTFLHSDEKFEEAVRYFVLAANQGFTNGEYNLGCCYKDGRRRRARRGPRPRVDGLLTSDFDRASRSSAMASIDIQVEEGGGGVVGW